MSKDQIIKYLKEHPEKKHRRFIPEIVQELTGVTPAAQIAVKVAIRRLQEQIPNDSFGRKKENEWLDERGMKSQGEFVRDGVLYRVSNQ